LKIVHVRKIHKHRCPANLSSPGIGFLLSAKLRR
jgi:hypothetical protein